MKTSKAQAKLDSGDIIFKTGDVARQANGAVLVQLKDTVILVTACIGKEPREDVSFFPLLVDYQEKTYAAGRIPGGFFKREGRPKDKEILSGRLVDRSIRPLFPEGIRNSIQVVCFALSSDAENDPDILAVSGASAALSISDIPFAGPIAAVRVIKTKEGFKVNPTYKQREEAYLDLVLSGSKDKILMIEAEAHKATETEAMEAIKLGHKSIKELISAQEKLIAEVGKPKKEVPLKKPDPDLLKLTQEKAKAYLKELSGKKDKDERDAAKSAFLATLAADPDFEGKETSGVKACLEKIEKESVRQLILKEKKRPDGRGLHDLRPVSCQVNFLPRTHGSALFTRGQTQALAVTTLGTTSDEQMIEALEGKSYKHFMLHYTFPPFSVGETSFLRGPSRRETGHGALAEKSIYSVLPSKEDFPYTIRVVSEILESNGSSSMASVCATSLSLMDAGVPIEDPVAGVAIGLVTDKDSYVVLVDIAGLEDHHGDMDFKVSGTADSISAIQLDLKVQGIGYDILEEGLSLAKKTRNDILEVMKKALDNPRPKVSKFAPKIVILKIAIDKVGELIGPGGRTIKRIISQAGVAVDINDEKGQVTVSAEDEASLNKGIEMVEEIIKDLEIGKTYKARVAKIMNFGAFCDIGPTKSGLLHVSEISHEYVKSVHDVLSEGDMIEVKVINIDDQGKVNLSKKQLEQKPTEDRRDNEKKHN